MDPGSGTFYAPFNGAYAFFFFSQFYCYGESNVLYAYRNDEQVFKSSKDHLSGLDQVYLEIYQNITTIYKLNYI
jgi:hypothetical protein